MKSVADLVAAEDVLLFVNAAVAATGQDEFHTGRERQEWSVDFLHEYMLVNYRDLYAAALVLGINDRNKAQIVLRLLKSGADTTPAQRAVEGRLIRRALRDLPTNRVYRLFTVLQRAKVNNRRTRAVMREWLSARPDPAFEAVKYRGAFKRAALHAHLDLAGVADDELAAFLFAPMKSGRFRTPLFETWRRAHYERAAVFELPYTVAEGFAVEHRIPRAVFLEQIAPNLTRNERLRLQRSGGDAVELDAAALGRMPLTRLAAYVLAIPEKERIERRDDLTGALRASAPPPARPPGTGPGPGAASPPSSTTRTPQAAQARSAAARSSSPSPRTTCSKPSPPTTGRCGCRATRTRCSPSRAASPRSENGSSTRWRRPRRRSSSSPTAGTTRRSASPPRSCGSGPRASTPSGAPRSCT
ncbi:hypothetical protein [Glycomyces dulcitolivorans]|uniref:hypothetical protein n=1 Tax=Glycomyces dulcitolivorans TaxID=2200759 RepID=UPI001E2CBBF4|nr:hypothetical protein [Glycomyces dulcitolivorans]